MDQYANYSDFSDYYYDHSNFTSLFPIPEPETLLLLSVCHGFTLFLYFLVVVLGVPGNGLVAWITAFDMKRTVSTIWFLNLAVADLLCSLCSSMNIMASILGHWPLGFFFCKFNNFILLSNMFASVFLLTMISIDRCALVMKPVWCKNNRTLGKAYLACAVIWILAIIFSIPYFIFRSTIEFYGKEHCLQVFSSISHDTRKRVKNIVILRLLIGFVVPFLVIVTCYSILVIRVKERFTENTKARKVVLVVIIGFFVCWFPYHVSEIFLTLSAEISNLFLSISIIHPLFVALAFMNSCINPIIYLLMSQGVKSAFKKSIQLTLNNVMAEDVRQTLGSPMRMAMLEAKNKESSV